MSTSFECLCKGCSWEATGEPAMACFCHCVSCQVYGGDAAQVAAFPPDKVKYNKGEDNLIVYESAPNKFRKTCKTCGTWVNNVLPNGLFVAPLGGCKFTGRDRIKPTMHIFTPDATRDLNDDLPKHEGFP